MRTAGLNHPKTKMLARRLSIPLPYAIGLLELLWDFVAKQTPRGDIGRWDNGVLADEAQWTGDADQFVSALVECGWLDESDEHRLVVHDWEDHMPSWVRAKLSKSKKKEVEPTIEKSIEPTTSLAKSSLVKPSQAKSKNPSGYTPEFEKAWASYPDRPNNNKTTAFRAYSARIRKGITAEEIQAGVERYAAYCDATGKTGQEFVKQGATFFGPDHHFAEPWDIPAGKKPESLKDKTYTGTPEEEITWL